MTDGEHRIETDTPCPACGERDVEVIEVRTDNSVIHIHEDGRRCIDPSSPSPTLGLIEDE